MLLSSLEIGEWNFLHEDRRGIKRQHNRAATDARMEGRGLGYKSDEFLVREPRQRVGDRRVIREAGHRARHRIVAKACEESVFEVECSPCDIRASCSRTM